jgi:hypothetical protein
LVKFLAKIIVDRKLKPVVVLGSDERNIWWIPQEVIWLWWASDSFYRWLS